uniref:C2H2-type domain-containing protein n=1 Tax=Sphaeramia orbicularis TaxID=375764 RepID=A0A673B2J7_9TELE
MLNFKCTHCSQKFRFKSIYLRHLVSHTGLQPYPCMHCGHRYPSKSTCLQHEAFCDGVNKEELSKEKRDAATILPSMPTLEKVSQVSRGVGETEYKCKFCTKTFVKPRSLRRHILTHNEVKPYRCKACDSCFSRYDHLKVHQNHCKGKRQRLEYQCSECEMSFTDGLLLISHLEDHGREEEAKRRNTCPKCGRVCSSQLKLEKHMKLHGIDKKIPCPDCSSMFFTKAELEIHRTCHDPNRPYQESQETSNDFDEEGSNVIYTKKGSKTVLKCGYCGRTFKFLSQFVIHQRIHTGERPFKCHECGKGFSKNSNLNLHLKTHRKSNIYQKCPYCEIKFSCSEYSAHMKMHEQDEDAEEKATEKESRGEEYEDGEKPYKCDICGKAFGQAYFLRVHELTHWSVKRYNCTRCGKSFTHYSNAKNHSCKPFSDDDLHSNRRVKPAHTGAKLYRCLFCDKLFGVLSEFNAHRGQCHQTKEEKMSSNLEDAEGETLSFIQYSVPALRCSSGQYSASILPGGNCELEKKQSQASQIRRKKRSANSKKPFQTTVIPESDFSHLVSKLNKLDNRIEAPQQTQLQQQQQQPPPQQHQTQVQQSQLSQHSNNQSPVRVAPAPSSPDVHGTFPSDPPTDTNGSDELTPLTCKECGLTFQHRSSLIKHRNEHIKEKEQQLLALKKEVRTTEGNFACAECQKVFYSVDKLRDHTCSNTVDKPYHCPLCRQEFQFKVSITKHMMSHSQESMFKCQECNQMFLNSMSLRYHQRCHSALKPYECPECGMVFKHYSGFRFSSYLQQHLIIHTGKKPYKCPDCGKDFAFLQNMKTHQKLHQEKPFRCTSCRKGYSDETQLQHHMLSHNGDKPHKCDLCDKSFGLAYLLRDHMNTHTGERPHRCEECHKSFSCVMCEGCVHVPSFLDASILTKAV